MFPPFIVKRKNEKHSIESVLTSFVDSVTTQRATSDRFCLPASRSSIHHNIMTPRTGGILASRALIESILEDMVLKFVQGREALANVSCSGRGNNNTNNNNLHHIVKSYVQTHPAKEIPGIAMYYGYVSMAKSSSRSLNCPIQQQQKHHPHLVNMVLNKLVDFLCLKTPVLDARQRKELKGKLHAYLCSNSPRGNINTANSTANTSSTNTCIALNPSFRAPQGNISSKHDINSRSSFDSSDNNKGSNNSNDENSKQLDDLKILQLLNVLKEGGYWKYLPKEHDDGGDDGGVEMDFITGTSSTTSHGEERQRQQHHHHQQHHNDDYDDYETNKENCSSYGNRTDDAMTSQDPRWTMEEVNDDEEEDDEEDDADTDNDCAFCACVLSSSSDHDGFYVRKVTDDGWLCSGTPGNSVDEDCHLLRLPLKLAKLGKDGMRISGIDLMQRSNNGVLEPCNTSEDDADSRRLFGTIHL
mmetsp:Transcript_12802/g.22318  ORF Transcript_12802/g.22318 Transcript_12802/m.22318 type:complete len:471 (+) Transcript_12802:236-1648(+)